MLACASGPAVDHGGASASSSSLACWRRSGGVETSIQGLIEILAPRERRGSSRHEPEGRSSPSRLPLPRDLAHARALAPGDQQRLVAHANLAADVEDHAAGQSGASGTHPRGCVQADPVTDGFAEEVHAELGVDEEV
jgi:hypothetical protein